MTKDEVAQNLREVVGIASEDTAEWRRLVAIVGVAFEAGRAEGRIEALSAFRDRVNEEAERREAEEFERSEQQAARKSEAARRSALIGCEKRRERTLANASERQRTLTNAQISAENATNPSAPKGEGGCLPPVPSSSAPLSSETPERAIPVLRSAEGEDFKVWYGAYPRKENRASAAKAWRQTEAVRPALPVLLGIMEQQKATGCLRPRTAEDGGSVIPYPASWLRGRRWEDEVVALPAIHMSDREQRGVQASLSWLEKQKAREANAVRAVPGQLESSGGGLSR